MFSVLLWLMVEESALCRKLHQAKICNFILLVMHIRSNFDFVVINLKTGKVEWSGWRQLESEHWWGHLNSLLSLWRRVSLRLSCFNVVHSLATSCVPVHSCACVYVYEPCVYVWLKKGSAFLLMSGKQFFRSWEVRKYVSSLPYLFHFSKLVSVY